METIEIKKSNVKAAYAAADENVKNVLTALFGDALKPKDGRPVTERILSYEDACRELGVAPIGDDYGTPDEVTYKKLKTIVKALNEGWEPKFTEDEWRYIPWFYLYTQEELDDMSESEKKERCMISIGEYQSEFAGFGFAYSTIAPSGAYALVGSHLCLRDSALAIACGKQFIKLWADFYLVRKYK